MNLVSEWSKKIIANVEEVFFGKTEVINKLLVGILCGGHVLLEDVPGLGKTILARALSVSIGGNFSRVQATPDLLPSDILGVSIYNSSTRDFSFKHGPIFSNIILVDEINRATPRTQSAFLEAMAENQVSTDEGIKNLPQPFFLIATENPAEFEGTFSLPEAQKDRFFMTVNIGYPSRESESKILESHRRDDHPINSLRAVSNVQELIDIKKIVSEIYVSESVKNYILDLIEKTRSSNYFLLGVSPRGTLALYKGAQAIAAIEGRDYVIPRDVKDIFYPILQQRVIIKAEFQIKGIKIKEALDSILNLVEPPPEVK